MKKVGMIVGYIFLGLLALMVICIGKDTLSSRSYSNRVCAGEELQKDDKLLLKQSFEITDNENILLVYTRGNSLKDGGVVLTNNRILSFLKGQSIKTCDKANLSEVMSVTFDSTKSFMNGSLINIEKIDSTAFAFSISQIQHSDVTFVERIRTEVRKNKKGE